MGKTAEEILSIGDPTADLDLKYSKMNTQKLTSNTKKITQLPDDFELNVSVQEELEDYP